MPMDLMPLRYEQQKTDTESKNELYYVLQQQRLAEVIEDMVKVISEMQGIMIDETELLMLSWKHDQKKSDRL